MKGCILEQLPYLTPAINNIDETWRSILFTICSTQLVDIDHKLQKLRCGNEIYPPRELIFNALAYVKPSEIKVVILGQDPYHGEYEANGLAFAVNAGIKLPPSLRNIYKELSLEYKGADLANANGELLINWAKQGVLLLNSSLTVLQNQANSLAHIGWSHVTDAVIQHISLNYNNIVFMLWGNFAKQKRLFIDKDKHLILESSHPSPLSAHMGFIGCGHFSKANQYLVEHGKNSIDWVKI